MRPQRRHFVVEVKRGTNRAAFISTDAAVDKFSSAEDALFGPRTVPLAAQPSTVGATADPGASRGRILRDLHEPAPPPPPEPPPPARRGRKPGSKNKPKPVIASLQPPSAAPGAAPAPERVAARPPAWADLLAGETTEIRGVPMAAPAPAASPASEEAASPTRRARLRDRSTIIKRYVLGTEPGPGQPGWIRGARMRRRP